MGSQIAYFTEKKGSSLPDRGSSGQACNRIAETFAKGDNGITKMVVNLG